MSSTFQNKIIRDKLIQIGAYVRLMMRARWAVDKGEHKDYRGLCLDGSTMVQNEIHKFYNQCMDRYGEHYCQWLFGTYEKPRIRHGELCHNSRIPSQYWEMQHTYVVWTVNELEWYIDITSQQFQWLDPSIPDFRVGNGCPWWIYEDRKNPRWEDRGFYGFLNRIMVVHGKNHHKDTLVEFFQYEVWARMCDLKRWFQRKKKPVCPF